MSPIFSSHDSNNNSSSSRNNDSNKSVASLCRGQGCHPQRIFASVMLCSLILIVVSSFSFSCFLPLAFWIYITAAPLGHLSADCLWAQPVFGKRLISFVLMGEFREYVLLELCGWQLIESPRDW